MVKYKIELVGARYFLFVNNQLVEVFNTDDEARESIKRRVAQTRKIVEFDAEGNELPNS